MCGIVGVAAKEVGNILLEGLRRLEYRATTLPGLLSLTLREILKG